MSRRDVMMSRRDAMMSCDVMVWRLNIYWQLLGNTLIAQVCLLVTMSSYICYIQGKWLLEGLFVWNSDKEGTSREGEPMLRRLHYGYITTTHVLAFDNVGWGREVLRGHPQRPTPPAKGNSLQGGEVKRLVHTFCTCRATLIWTIGTRYKQL